MEKRIKTIERICVIGIVVLSVVILLGILLLDRIEQPSQQPPATEVSLTEWDGYLPDAIDYGRKLPVTSFRAGDGSERDLSEW